MNFRIRRITGLFFVIAVSSSILFGSTTHLFAADRIPLRILLTNDDGYDAPGIQAVHATLLAAGHQVTVVAPVSNQSGSGVRVTTSGIIGYKEQSPGVWSVEGSPADSVLVGLIHILKDQLPDIVISGANFGPNLGYGSSSGTVGAATMAMYGGIPAIAISVGINPAERDAKPIRFPSTIGAFPDAAALTLQIIDSLQAGSADNGTLLPENTILNVNYPVVDPDEIAGVRVVQAARGSGVRINYEDTGQAGQLEIGVRLMEPEETNFDDTDLPLFNRGFVTITVLDGDWDAGEQLRSEISGRLSTIGEH